MRIDLSYNDVNLELYVSNRNLDQHKMTIIRNKTFEFFDSIQELFTKEEIAKEISFCIKYPEELLVKEQYMTPEELFEKHKITGSVINEPIKIIPLSPEYTNTGEPSGIKLINPETGDKRVGKKRFEDIPVEELGTDVRGMPWNPEIHASTKAKRKDGTWKLKKGANLIQSTEKEKKILQELPPPPPIEEEIKINNRKIPKTFNEMMNLIDEIIESGRIDTAGVMRVLADLGFNSILHLRDNVAAYDKIYQQFHTILGGIL